MISLEIKVHPLKRLFEKYHFNGLFTGENDF
jgi:3'-phosphoadenosine 5'-phosphosulfate sulfotransferase (PAPS reductase)/FAD synthetase